MTNYDLSFSIHNDYTTVYDLGGYRRHMPGKIRVEVGCGLIDDGRKMCIEEFLHAVENLPDEKAWAFSLVLKECNYQMLEMPMPHRGSTITMSELCVIMLPFINEKLERVAYEEELDKYLNETA